MWLKYHNSQSTYVHGRQNKIRSRGLTATWHFTNRSGYTESNVKVRQQKYTAYWNRHDISWPDTAWQLVKFKFDHLKMCRIRTSGSTHYRWRRLSEKLGSSKQQAVTTLSWIMRNSQDLMFYCGRKINLGKICEMKLGHLRTGHEGPEGEKYCPTSALEDGGWSTPRSVWTEVIYHQCFQFFTFFFSFSPCILSVFTIITNTCTLFHLTLWNFNLLKYHQCFCTFSKMTCIENTRSDRKCVMSQFFKCHHYSSSDLY